jgi:hypothetical protein
MSTKLPERIAYLASVMNDLSAFDPATLGDDNGSLSALLSGSFAITGVAALVARKFDAGFGGIILALLLGWVSGDWLRMRKTE